MRRLVAAWKERGLRRLAEDAAELVAERVPRPPAVGLTFVPADSSRRAERGHHPAERMARSLAVHWQLPCQPLLARTREARRQRGLSRVARQRNVARAFTSRGIAGAVVLVDDVYTSGSTASSAAAALLAAGAGRVDVVTFARVIRIGYYS